MEDTPDSADLGTIIRDYKLTLHLRVAFNALNEGNSKEPTFVYHPPNDSTPAHVTARLPTQGSKRVNFDLSADGKLGLTLEYWIGTSQLLPGDLGDRAELMLKGWKTYRFNPGTSTIYIKDYKKELGIDPKGVDTQKLDLELKPLKK